MRLTSGTTIRSIVSIAEVVGSVVSSAVGITAAVVSGKDAAGDKVKRIAARLKEYETYACHSMVRKLSPPSELQYSKITKLCPMQLTFHVL